MTLVSTVHVCQFAFCKQMIFAIDCKTANNEKVTVTVPQQRCEKFAKQLLNFVLFSFARQMYKKVLFIYLCENLFNTIEFLFSPKT